jgi:death on curing protein
VNEPLFLTLGQVLELHERAILMHGGTLGIRDQGGLESAINHPKNVFFYSAGDLFDMAAAYAISRKGNVFLMETSERQRRAH